jgi:predicted lipoprotein with Yx(FWY)xxD motif
MGILLATLALVAAACSTSDASTDTTGAPTPTTQAPTSATDAPTPTTEAPTSTTEAGTAGAVVMVADSSLGSILVDGDGNTLYLFTPDEQGESVCYDQCEASWPPLVDEVVAGDGVDAALLGAVARTDGSQQVTYNGWPLYHFANDAAPGDTNGQGINDIWYVLDGAGEAIGLGG